LVPPLPMVPLLYVMRARPIVSWTTQVVTQLCQSSAASRTPEQR
jgi:hypothetical protein